MKHVFLINSNITSICAYDTVKQLNSKGESVIILLIRNTKWQFDDLKVTVLDFSRYAELIYNKMPRIRTLSDIILSMRIIKRIKTFGNRLFDYEEYVMYIPQYRNILASSLCKNKFCKGYYFLEEGIGAYASIQWNKEAMGYSSFFHIISIFTGAPYYTDYYTNNKMKGTIALSDSAFPWYSGNKTVNKFEYPFDRNVYEKKRTIIILPPVTKDCDSIKVLLNDLIRHLNADSSNTIALKFHPRTGDKERNGIALIKEFIGNKVEILPDDFVVEYNLMAEQSAIYSIIVKSSLLVYAINYHRKAYFVDYSNNGLLVEEIATIQEALK